jgi:hypothetical protein
MERGREFYISVTAELIVRNEEIRFEYAALAYKTKELIYRTAALTVGH